MSFKKGHKGFRTQDSYTEAGRKFSEKYKGDSRFTVNLGDGMKGRKHSPETKLKMKEKALARKQKGVPKMYCRKENPKTDWSKIWRRRSEYKEWRNAVYTRDNWTCRKCGVRGGVIHPHHVKLFAKHPEDRFNVDNGVTLCVKCHKDVHKYKDTDYLCEHCM